MRHMTVKVPPGRGQDILELAKQQEAVNMACLGASDLEEAWDVVLFSISNNRVGTLMNEFQSIDQLQVTLAPHPIIPMVPSREGVARHVKNVQNRSPLEVWLNGLQSIGSWKGFLSYAVASSFVVWSGMYTNTIYLLVAAMLIAPFAAPAMTLAIATASGDKTLLWRSLVRYFVSITVMIVITGLISVLLGLETATNTMVSVSQVSRYFVLLALTAGAAGALNQIQAQNNSLVSGAAVGLLVAAALAPPAGLVGMASALGMWDMAKSGVFLLLLQLVGINLAGAITYRIFGLNTDSNQYNRGSPAIYWASLLVTGAALLGLLYWQFSTAPNLERSTLAQELLGEVQQVVEDSDLAYLVEANLRFTRPTIADQNTLLGVVYLQPRPGVDLPVGEIQQQLTRSIQERILAHDYPITPLIDVTVLESPGASAGAGPP